MSDNDSNREQYKSLSLFSGAMGLDIGVHNTGNFKLLGVVEKEPVYCDTIRLNIKAGNLPNDIVVYQDDISKMNPYDLMDDLQIKQGEIDLLIGGPPCQSFSTAGKRGTLQDPRGTLIWDFLRFIEALKPKIFLMENVRGLMSAAIRHRPIADRPENGGKPLTDDEKPGSVVRLFAEDLSNLESSYHLDVFEVNAVNYGAPQLRERVLFIGNRYNKIIDFPNPTHGKYATDPDDENKISNETENGTFPWATLGSVIRDLNEKNPEILDFSPRKKKYLALIPPGGNWRSLPVEIQKESMGKAFYAKGGRSGWWRRLSFDLPSPTLVTMPNHASTSLCHPSEIRALSVKEYCRIQEFPDNWILSGKIAQKYTQIGNAVPVRLGKIAGDVIIQELDKIINSGYKKIEGETPPFRRVYIRSHVRTRNWYKAGQPVLWVDGDKNDAAAYKRMKTNRDYKAIKMEK